VQRLSPCIDAASFVDNPWFVETLVWVSSIIPEIPELIPVCDERRSGC
jgi:hypothetical protein